MDRAKGRPELHKLGPTQTSGGQGWLLWPLGLLDFSIVTPSTCCWAWYWWSSSLAEIDGVHSCFYVSIGKRVHRIFFLSTETILKMKSDKWNKVVVPSPSCPLFSEQWTLRNWSLISNPNCESVPEGRWLEGPGGEKGGSVTEVANLTWLNNPEKWEFLLIEKEHESHGFPGMPPLSSLCRAQCGPILLPRSLWEPRAQTRILYFST